DKGRLSAIPLAMVVDGESGRKFLPFDDSHVRAALDEATSLLSMDEFVDLLPAEPARGTFASNAQGRYYGFKEFSDYFTPRQLVGLITLIHSIDSVRDQIHADALEAQM